VNDIWKEIVKDFLSVRSCITLGAFMTIYILTWKGTLSTDIVVRIADTLLGFWFGSKVANAALKGGKNEQ